MGEDSYLDASYEDRTDLGDDGAFDDDGNDVYAGTDTSDPEFWNESSHDEDVSGFDPISGEEF